MQKICWEGAGRYVDSVFFYDDMNGPLLPPRLCETFYEVLLRGLPGARFVFYKREKNIS